jgi:hypothetical protein
MAYLDTADTILQQLGGQRFIAMTGARGMVAGKNSLTFRLPRSPFNQKRINAVQIELTPADTYRISFYRISPAVSETVIAVHDDVYCDELADVFTQETNLLTHL